MPTLKSKLKEYLNRRINEESKNLIANPNDEVSKARYNELIQINDICIERKRY